MFESTFAHHMTQQHNSVYLPPATITQIISAYIVLDPQVIQYNLSCLEYTQYLESS